MGRIFCLIGKSGSGKDSIFELLSGDKTLGLRGVVTYTTRPMRDGERDGEQYYFVSKEDLDKFDKSGRLIEIRRYDTVKGAWYYATVDDGQIDISRGNYLMILTPRGCLALKKRFGDENVVPVYLEVEDGERLDRALKRERKSANPQYKEMCRRFLADCEDFSEERLKAAGVSKRYINDDLAACAGIIRKDITEEK
jgi:guanylate kinase